jgi:hypothetical protein
MYIILFFLETILLFYLSRALHKRLSFLFYKLVKKQKIVIWITAILFLPGTLIHESTHFLSALFLFVPVGNFNIIPSYQKKKVKLGSVSVGKSDPFRSFFISTAPFVAGNILIYLFANFFLNRKMHLSLYLIILITYFLLAVANTMFLSKSDFKGVWKLLLVMVIFYIVFYFLGFKISSDFINSVINFTDPVFKNLSLFLLIPVGLDVIANLFLAIVSGKTFIHLIPRKE